MTDYTQQVSEALDKLGATAPDIAQTLANKGIRGVCGNSEKCAIANYLTEQFPEFQWALGTGIFGFDGPPTASPAIAMPIPKPVLDFIHAFDGNRYPELVTA